MNLAILATGKIPDTVVIFFAIVLFAGCYGVFVLMSLAIVWLGKGWKLLTESKQAKAARLKAELTTELANAEAEKQRLQTTGSLVSLEYQNRIAEMDKKIDALKTKAGQPE